MNIIPKKLISGDKDVEEIFETASLLGVGIIECRWIKNGDSIREVIGYQVPGMLVEENLGMSADAEWVDGTVKFFPDKRSHRWGYIYDTPKNRELLVHSLPTGWFIIVDQNIKREITKDAEVKGVPTEPIPKPVINVKRTKRELEANRHIETLERSILELKSKLAKAEKEKSDTESEKEKYVSKRINSVDVDEYKSDLPEKESKDKPLKGVRIKRDKK